MPQDENQSNPARGERCSGVTKAGRPCSATPCGDSGFCRNHDPAEAARRREAGRIRHPKTRDFAGEPIPVEKRRTLSGLTERLIDIADRVEEGSLDPETAKAAIAAVKAACERHEKELDRRLKKAPGRPRAEPPETTPAQPAEPAPAAQSLIGAMVAARERGMTQ